MSTIKKGAAVELGTEAKGHRKKVATEQKGVTFFRNTIHTLLAQRIPLSAGKREAMDIGVEREELSDLPFSIDDAKTVAAGALALLRLDKHNPDTYHKDIEMTKAWINDKNTRCVRYFLDVDTRKTLMKL